MPLLPQWLLLHILAGMTIGALEAGRFQFMATLVLSGLLIGVAQWFVLRQVFPRASCWIWASAIGWLVGIQIRIGLGGLLDPIVAQLTQMGGGEVFWLNVVKQPIVLTGMGAAQSLFLWLFRREICLLVEAQSANRLPGAWIAISAVAGAFQGGSSALFCAVICPSSTGQLGPVLTTAIVYGVGWFSYSGATAVLLYKLLFSRVLEN